MGSASRSRLATIRGFLSIDDICKARKMSLKHWWLGSVVMNGVLGATSVYAECEPLPLPEKVLGYSVCKEWPAYEGQTITALSKIESAPTLDDPRDGSGTYGLNLAVIADADGRPLASYTEASVFYSDIDMVKFNGLDIDTARYNLAPGLSAFSVRADFTSSSGSFHEVLVSLYVREGNSLRPVLEQLSIESGSGARDTVCAAGKFSHTKRTLDVAKTRSHGFFDLIVKSVINNSVATENEGKCEYKDAGSKTLVKTLHYNGRQYVVPEEMQSYEYD
jgi:hypothetical protein